MAGRSSFRCRTSSICSTLRGGARDAAPVRGRRRGGDPVESAGALGGSRAPLAKRRVRSETDGVGKVLYKAGDDADRAVIDALAGLAETRGLPMASLALAWHFTKTPVAAPIIGATRPQHIADAVGALDITLSEADVDADRSALSPQMAHRNGNADAPPMDRVSLLV